MAVSLGPRGRTVVRYTAIGVVAVVVFLIALQLTFPYDRVRDRVVDALSSKYDVTITDVDRSWVPGRVYFNGVSLRTRPERAGEPITTFYIDKLELDVSLWSLLRKNASLDLTAWIGPGKLAGNITLRGFGKKGLDVTVAGHGLPGDLLPMRAVLGLPMTGKLEVALSLDLPYTTSRGGRVSPDWKKAVGSASFGCPHGCTFGDGKTRLKPILKNTTSQAMVGDGIEFGKVNIDSLLATAEIKNDKLEVTKFDAKSGDGVLKVDFRMSLQPNLGDSVVDGCLRFNGSPALLKREPKTYAAITASGADLRSDGLFHIKLMGEVKEMRRLNMECGPQAGEHGSPEHGPPTRPHITLMPEQPLRPPPGATITPPVRPAMPAAPPPSQAPGAHTMMPTMHPPPGPEGEAPPAGSAEAPGSADDRGEDRGEGSAEDVPPGQGTAGAGGVGQLR